MAVTKQQKADILAGLVEKFKEAKSIGFASTSTLTVDDFYGLRKGLREVQATYTLAKKTLIKKAIKDALDIDLDLKDLPGQIGAVCSNEDSVAGLGKVNDLVKETKGEKITWTISIFEGELKCAEETKTIAAMPSRDTLLGRLVGSMKSPVGALARFFDAAKSDLEKKEKTKISELKGAEDVKAETKETPKVEEKKEETKAEETPKAEAPKVETKKEEIKAEEAPKEESPKEEAPKEEAKSEETPVETK